MNTIYDPPLLTPEEEKQLFARIKDDPSARDKIITANQRLVYKICQKYRGQMDWDDIVQEGLIGLIQAVDRFDPAKGAKFSTYAYPAIDHRIYRAINENTLIRRPEGSREKTAIVSLDANNESSDRDYLEAMPAPEDPKTELYARVIDYAMSLLDERDQRVLKCFFLQTETKEKLCAEYGITHATLIHWKNNALRRLREPDIIDKLRELSGGEVL